MMSEEIRAFLTEQFGDDREIHEELYSAYRRDFAAGLERYDRACGAEECAAAAHALKGMALQIGDASAAAVAKALQLAVQSGDSGECAALRSRLG